METSIMTLLFKSRFSHSVLRNDFGGISIAFVFFIILMFTILGTVGFSIMKVDSQFSLRYVQGLQAQYMSEAGVEYGLKRLFSGDELSASEYAALTGGSFTLQSTTEDTIIILTSTGAVGTARKMIRVRVRYRPPIGDFAIFSTGDIEKVNSLDENGDPDPNLMVENAPTMPDIDDQALLDMAAAQGNVKTAATFEPAHGYPNFNFYLTGTTPNVTHCTGNMRVRGGRTVYGIFIVEGNITLDGSARVVGVLYMINPGHILIHGGGSPSESSVTGGIIANGDIDGTGNHITVYYNPEYMGMFETFETGQQAVRVVSWEML
jgi:hypothetical protein